MTDPPSAQMAARHLFLHLGFYKFNTRTKFAPMPKPKYPPREDNDTDKDGK